MTRMGIPIPTNDSEQTRIKLNGRFRNIDGEATNKQVSLDMTDTPFTKYKFQATLYLIGNNQTTSGRKRGTFLLQQQIVKKISFKKKTLKKSETQKTQRINQHRAANSSFKAVQVLCCLAAACPAQGT